MVFLVLYDDNIFVHGLNLLMQVYYKIWHIFFAVHHHQHTFQHARRGWGTLNPDRYRIQFE